MRVDPASSSGIILREREGLEIVRIAARRAQASRVAELIRSRFGLELPNAPRHISRGDIAMAGIAPDAWIATRESTRDTFAPCLRSLLGPAASITDQSDAYVMLRLAGPRLREAMAKLVPLDVHARSFRVGDVAQTLCGHINVTLWRLDDTVDGDPVFELWAGRSLEVSLHRAIGQSAAEFGFVREPTDGTASAGRGDP